MKFIIIIMEVIRWEMKFIKITALSSSLRETHLHLKLRNNFKVVKHIPRF